MAKNTGTLVIAQVKKYDDQDTYPVVAAEDCSVVEQNGVTGTDVQTALENLAASGIPITTISTFPHTFTAADNGKTFELDTAASTDAVSFNGDSYWVTLIARTGDGFTIDQSLVSGKLNGVVGGTKVLTGDTPFPTVIVHVESDTAVASIVASNVPSAVVGGGGIQNVTYADLYNGVDGLVDLAQLVPGQKYCITDFQTRHQIPLVITYGAWSVDTEYSIGDRREYGLYVWESLQDGNIGNIPEEGVYWTQLYAYINEGPNEQLVVTAVDSQTLAPEAFSLLHPNDIIQYKLIGDYDWSSLSGNNFGYITFRRDENDNESYYDLRYCKWRRWETIENSSVFNSTQDTGYAYQDFFTFNANAIGNTLGNKAYDESGCYNNVFAGEAKGNLMVADCYNMTFLQTAQLNRFLKTVQGATFEQPIFGCTFDSEIIGSAPTFTLAYSGSVFNSTPIYIPRTQSNDNGAIGKPNLWALTYQELADLVTYSRLIPGQKYQITDYVTGYTRPIIDDTIVSSPFPLIVTALTANELCKKAYSPSYPNAEFEYHFVSPLALWDDITTLDPNATTGFISRTVDMRYNIDVPCDLYNVYLRRYNDGEKIRWWNLSQAEIHNYTIIDSTTVRVKGWTNIFWATPFSITIGQTANTVTVVTDNLNGTVDFTLQDDMGYGTEGPYNDPANDGKTGYTLIVPSVDDADITMVQVDGSHTNITIKPRSDWTGSAIRFQIPNIVFQGDAHDCFIGPNSNNCTFGESNKTMNGLTVLSEAYEMFVASSLQNTLFHGNCTGRIMDTAENIVFEAYSNGVYKGNVSQSRILNHYTGIHYGDFADCTLADCIDVCLRSISGVTTIAKNGPRLLLKRSAINLYFDYPNKSGLAIPTMTISEEVYGAHTTDYHSDLEEEFDLDVSTPDLTASLAGRIRCIVSTGTADLYQITNGIAYSAVGMPRHPIKVLCEQGYSLTIHGVAYESISADGQFMFQGDITINSLYDDWVEFERVVINNGSEYWVWKIKSRSIYE